MTRAIGILGGTFDPIHHAHLRMGIELGEALHLSEVRFIPCYQPVHREAPIATPKQRLTMVSMAIADEPLFHLDEREIYRKQPSYMVETLIDLKKEFPRTPLFLLIGIDSFLNFTTWHRFEKILNLSHIVIARRPPYQIPPSGILAELLKKHIQVDLQATHHALNGSIFLCPMTSLAISGTEIRNQISEGKNVRYLLPNSVYNYIQEQHLYHSLEKL